MSKKLSIILKLTFCLCIILLAEYYLISQFLCPQSPAVLEENVEETPKGMMILIEYTDMVGLSNFVSEMYKRGITGAFFTGPEFVEEHCDDIKKLLEYENIEIMAAYTKDPLWDMSYEQQYEVLKDSKDRIEECTGKPVKILSSKYQATDENTAKVADALGVPYLAARGTTETEAFVYQPEEYNVKILSISNIPSIRFKYGSLCDYSYWVRGGSPEDMMIELEAAKYNKKVTPLSHTKIGGIKERWLNMWLSYFDTYEIDWVSLDEIMSTDMTLPYWQIPQNHNNPYTPSAMQPDLELSEEKDINNPCAVNELPFVRSSNTINEQQTEEVVIFSNGTGSMCIEAEEYFKQKGIEYTLYLTSDPNFNTTLEEYKLKYGNSSEGVSTSFGYYPFIFVQDKAYSGFNETIGESIMELL